MDEEYWANSQFSIARHYGGVNINGKQFIIVNKEGKDIYECSLEADREGREKAIPPGEPADLVLNDFVPYYRKLGRDEFLRILTENNKADHTTLHEIYKNATRGK